MGEILFEVRASVAILTLSNVDVRNALTQAMNEELIRRCDEIDATPEIGAVVVQGAGGTFCAGSDRREWLGAAADPASQAGYQRTSIIYRTFLRFGSLSVPTIAAVRGVATGGGLNLALAADVRIVAHEARLVGGFLQNGLHPGGGLFTLLGRSAGREMAAAIGLLGIEISGRQAASAGLALESLPDDQVEQRAWEYASIAARDPELTRIATQSYREQLGPPPVPWSIAAESDRGKQMWSHRRRQDDGGRATDGSPGVGREPRATAP
ncbi:enoyl-CoA hydratase/isomerase family protein [Actinophytocola sp.]|uniref:enoyl-CoA hydratase/isomerase family protein n=1 Tax=Actinophytocola sp. TaxID=1872138 RepID=UPI003D6B4B7D